jgi:hypothetical protein
MTKANGLHKLYDRLTLAERFAADVETMARGDRDESEYPTDTCPRRSYTVNDWCFVGRWTAARELSLLAHMDLSRCLDKIQVLEAFRRAWEGLDGRRELEDLQRRMAAEGLTHWAVFCGFCAEEMGVEPAKVLAAVTPHAAQKAEELEDRAARLGAEPDPASVREYRETMEALWHRVLAKGAGRGA